MAALACDGKALLPSHIVQASFGSFLLDKILSNFKVHGAIAVNHAGFNCLSIKNSASVSAYALKPSSSTFTNEQTSKSSCSIVYSSQLEHHFSTITTKKAMCTSYISNQIVRPIMFVYLLWPANPLLLMIMKRILSSLSVCILLFGLHKTMKPVRNTHCHFRSNFCQQMFFGGFVESLGWSRKGEDLFTKYGIQDDFLFELITSEILLLLFCC